MFVFFTKQIFVISVLSIFLSCSSQQIADFYNPPVRTRDSTTTDSTGRIQFVGSETYSTAVEVGKPWLFDHLSSRSYTLEPPVAELEQDESFNRNFLEGYED